MKSWDDRGKGKGKRMTKTAIVKTSVLLHNVFLKRYNAELDLVRNGSLVTQHMRYDKITESLCDKYRKYLDYMRYRTFELVADEIRHKYSVDELADFSVAEAGVFLGDFAWIINERFPECKLYLYDTFEGFDKDDMMNEINSSYITEESLSEYNDMFGNTTIGANERITIVKKKMKFEKQCVFRKGRFPDSIGDECNNKWIFVSLDMDLYLPIKEGIKFFWPNMVEGGVHDYNNVDFAGIKDAISEIEEEFGRIKKVPLSDQGGTMVLCK